MYKLTTQSLIQELSPFVVTCRVRGNLVYFTFRNYKHNTVMAILSDYLEDGMFRRVDTWNMDEMGDWMQVEVEMLDDSNSQ